MTREYRPAPERAGYLLPDDYPADGRGYDAGHALAEPARQIPAEPLGYIGVLEQERALEIPVAVKPGRQEEMPLEQGALLLKQF